MHALPSCPRDPVTDRPAMACTRRRAALGLASALLLGPLAACATEAPQRWHPVSMSIVDRETGQPLTMHVKDGRSYVAGRPATRYAIRVANRTGGRVLVVLSVDGVNVISGQTAAVGQRGYVLAPWQSADIAGWRKSDSEIAAFVFAALDDSYAARTGRPDNVGVIGLAAFLEKPAPAPQPPASPPVAADALGRAAAASGLRNEAADAGPRAPSGASQLAKSERLGTGHGEREPSFAGTTRFERLSASPQDVIEIAYDSPANLIAAGIIPEPIASARPPRPFPRDDPRGFVPDPPAR